MHTDDSVKFIFAQGVLTVGEYSNLTLGQQKRFLVSMKQRIEKLGKVKFAS